MKDKYSEDERELKQNQIKLTQQLNQTQQVLDQTTRALLNIQAKLEYIQYRREKEKQSEGLEEDTDPSNPQPKGIENVGTPETA